jgi:hypothetical protein
MKFFALLLSLMCAPLSHLFAQVTVEVVLDQEHFLIGEALPAAVRITNRSGQTLQFGSDPDWLRFSVESRDGLIVAKNGDAPVEGEFKLEAGQVATRRVDLAPYFALNRIGRYQIIATVRLKAWNTEATTKPKAFDIIHGAKIWSQDIGVPVTGAATTRPPEARRYTLEQANYLRSQLRLYLRLTDVEESRVIKVFPLGPMVSFGNPEHQIDKESQLHVLYQNGARSFSYTVINPDGDVVIRQTYDYTGSRPRLELSEEGKLVVAGGVRRIAASDVPETKPSETDGPAEKP